MVYKVFLDFEATGLSTLNDEITQIGAVGVNGEDDCNIMEFKTYVHTSRKIHPKASEVTGITNEMLKNAPKKIDALLMMLEWIQNSNTTKEAVVLIAYNGFRYDFKLLFNELKRVDMSPIVTLSKYSIKYFMDPFMWSKQFIDRSCLIRKKNGSCSYKLGDIHEAVLGKCFENAHDALADTLALYNICNHNLFKKMEVNCEGVYCKETKVFIASINIKSNKRSRKSTMLSFSSKKLKNS